MSEETSCLARVAHHSDRGPTGLEAKLWICALAATTWCILNFWCYRFTNPSPALDNALKVQDWAIFLRITRRFQTSPKKSLAHNDLFFRPSAMWPWRWWCWSLGIKMWILMIFLATASDRPGTHEQLMGVIDPAIRSICISPRRLETRVEKTLGGKTEGNGGCSGGIFVWRDRPNLWINTAIRSPQPTRHF